MVKVHSSVHLSQYRQYYEGVYRLYTVLALINHSILLCGTNRLRMHS